MKIILLRTLDTWHEHFVFNPEPYVVTWAIIATIGLILNIIGLVAAERDQRIIEQRQGDNPLLLHIAQSSVVRNRVQTMIQVIHVTIGIAALYTPIRNDWIREVWWWVVFGGLMLSAISIVLLSVIDTLSRQLGFRLLRREEGIDDRHIPDTTEAV